jgi:UDP:flavonoid glycosyltransferase YjiC (YdhE family)
MRDSLRIMVATVGWTGHAYPAFALARELRHRGHEVVVESFERWRDIVEGIDLRFAPATEQIAFDPGAAGGGVPSLAEVALDLQPLLAELEPDLVVTDSWTLAPALAAEVAGIPRATLIPHPFPVHEPGLPFYPLGLLPPRTPVGRLAWRLLWPAIGTRLPNTRLRRVRAGIDANREQLGLAPLSDYDGQISEQLALVATFPQLEYPRRWPDHVHITGPMQFELDYPDVAIPRSDDPLVVVASSTERDPERRLASIAVEALADEPVRVLVALNRRGASWDDALPANTTVVDWARYGQLMPAASAVICHGGHGTVARALAAGTPAIVVPPAGDMAEIGARVAWAGVGLTVPNRLLRPGALRASARRLIGEPRFGAAARRLAAWARTNNGASTGAELAERAARCAYR